MSSVSLIASPTAQYLLQSLVGSTYSRRLLLHRHPSEAAAASPELPPDSSRPPSSSSFSANVVMVLAVLLIAVTCALALNSIARCALRCSGLLGSHLLADGDVAAAAAAGGHAGAPKGRAPMKASLPTLAYSSGLRLAGAESGCVICLSEFAVGERLRVLPGCEHGFHAQCIDRWLRSHSSCPTCRQCLFGTCRRISGSGGGEERQQGGAPVQTIITPLQPEGLII